MYNHKKLVATGALLGSSLLAAASVHAGATFKIDDTKWLSVGAGMRTSFSAVEDLAGTPTDPDWSTDFDLNNIRLYVNGKLHKYIGIEFNTECQNCSDGGDLRVLDAIAKFDFTKYFNLWVGRLLVPSDRAELDGPFYHNTFEFNKTPFYPSDHGNDDAGRFGRDDGFNIWGALTPDKRLTYVVGVFDGLDGGANVEDNLLYAGRVSYNFLNVEQNPGYYTSSTYYGSAGDVLTVAAAVQYQQDGSGSAVSPGDFLGASADVLFEKVFANNGVLTLEGEYKYFDADLSATALADPTCFCLFDGDAYTGTILYLFPQKVYVGRVQPYFRYTSNEADNSSDRDEYEFGINYVIDGHNARISLMYQYGDIETKGRFNWVPGATGDEVSAIKLGLQIQL